MARKKREDETPDEEEQKPKKPSRLFFTDISEFARALRGAGVEEAIYVITTTPPRPHFAATPDAYYIVLHAALSKEQTAYYSVQVAAQKDGKTRVLDELDVLVDAPGAREAAAHQLAELSMTLEDYGLALTQGE